MPDMKEQERENKEKIIGKDSLVYLLPGEPFQHKRRSVIKGKNWKWNGFLKDQRPWFRIRK